MDLVLEKHQMQLIMEMSGSNTLEGIYNNTNLKLPNMKKLGLYNIDGLSIPEKEENPIGIYGKAVEKTKGKNSPVGHWEMILSQNIH